MSTLTDVFILSGTAVGDGSIVYADTLCRAKPDFYSKPQWGALADWQGDVRYRREHATASITAL